MIVQPSIEAIHVGKIRIDECIQSMILSQNFSHEHLGFVGDRVEVVVVPIYQSRVGHYIRQDAEIEPLASEGVDEVVHSLTR